jgi:hypothetical protein
MLLWCKQLQNDQPLFQRETAVFIKHNKSFSCLKPAILLFILMLSVPVLQTSLSGKNPRINSALLNESSSFLFDLEQASPPDLKKRINSLRRNMRSFDFDGLLAVKQ